MCECLQCGEKVFLFKIKATDSQYDGLYICESCLERNESDFSNDMRDW